MLTGLAAEQPPGPSVKPAAETPDAIGEAALLLLGGLGATTPWQHRVVERVELGTNLVHRRVTVDFTAPAGGGQALVPLLLLPKDRGGRFDMNVVDERGVAVPLATREQSAAVAVTVLRVRIQQTGRSLSEKLSAVLTGLVVSPESPSTRLALEVLLREGGLDDDPVARDLLSVFECQALMCVIVRADGERRLLRLGWVEPMQWRPRRNLLSRRVVIEPTHVIPGTHSNTLEIRLPHQLRIAAWYLATGPGKVTDHVTSAATAGMLDMYEPQGTASTATAAIKVVPASAILGAAAVTAMWTAIITLLAAVNLATIGRDASLLAGLALPAALAFTLLAAGAQHLRHAPSFILTLGIIATFPGVATAIYVVADPGRPARGVLVFVSAFAATTCAPLLVQWLASVRTLPHRRRGRDARPVSLASASTRSFELLDDT